MTDPSTPTIAIHAPFRRVRSVSLSSEVDCPRLLLEGDMDEPVFKAALASSAKDRSTGCSYLMTRHDFSRALSSNCIDKYTGNGYARLTFRRISLCQDDAPMEFEDLPEECKLNVFSFLTIRDRGVAAQVCTSWHTLMRTASLWTFIDLMTFQACYVTGKNNHQCTYLCYAQYRHRLKRFLEFLISIRPTIKTLKFALDIDDPADGYRSLLVELIRHAHCHELTVAELIWTETPAKRPFAWQSVSATWSTSHIRDLVYRRHHRQRHFVRFFDLFTATVKNVAVLSLPFDWSDNSLNLLRRLTELRDVTLRKYFRYATVDREFFRAVFASLPCLRRLTVELWTESAGGFSYFQIQSRTLEYLDVTMCRGLFVSEMSLPSLVQFHVSRSPFYHVLGVSLLLLSGVSDTPCIYDVLRCGAPRLRQLNAHVLHADWRMNTYPELELELSNVCSCVMHKPVAPPAN